MRARPKAAEAIDLPQQPARGVFVFLLVRVPDNRVTVAAWITCGRPEMALSNSVLALETTARSIPIAGQEIGGNGAEHGVEFVL